MDSPEACLGAKTRLGEKTKEEYCVYNADDDFIIPNSIDKCVDFLDANPDYGGVGGLAIACGIDADVHTKVDSAWRYDVPELFKETATERVYELTTKKGVVLYSLARTEQFKKMFPAHEENVDLATANELLPCAVLAAQGKVKMLHDLFVVRQIHHRRVILPMLFETMVGPYWASSTNNRLS